MYLCIPNLFIFSLHTCITMIANTLLMFFFISREIAKLRLQEAKVREELEASKQRAEREIREARLKSLELKAAVVRTSSAGGRSWRGSALEDRIVAENTRKNASPLTQRAPSRERARSPHALSARQSSSVQNSVQYATHQREIAEEVYCTNISMLSSCNIGYNCYLFVIRVLGSTKSCSESARSAQSTGAQRGAPTELGEGETEREVGDQG